MKRHRITLLTVLLVGCVVADGPPAAGIECVWNPRTRTWTHTPGKQADR